MYLCVFLALRRLDPRNEALLEAVVKQVQTTRHRGWKRVMQTCVQKTSRRACGFVYGSERSACRSKGLKGEVD